MRTPHATLPIPIAGYPMAPLSISHILVLFSGRLFEPMDLPYG